MGKPHALAIPFPGQGHVLPLMELSHCLATHGFKITFVATEHDYNRMEAAAALRATANDFSDIELVSIPDGLAPGEDRSDFPKLCDAISRVMPGCLEDLIAGINGCGGDRITCIIADKHMAWALVVAQKLGIQGTMFWPSSVSFWMSMAQIPELIEAGIIEENGNLTKQHMIKISPVVPAMNTAHFGWLSINDPLGRRTIFQYIARNTQIAKNANWILCNSFHEIEPACDFDPHILTVGPLLAAARLEIDFWQNDTTTLDWLDKQPACSVVYVGFGNLTTYGRLQLHELAFGLELLNLRFLWSVQPDTTMGSSITYPDDFLARIAASSRIAVWAHQKKVLGHPSVACFMTHCGWNSTIEGLSNGVPLLCWPYFADQFLHKAYICDVWRVGLELNKDSNGIITRDEIKEKVDKLLSDEGIRAMALELKDTAKRSIEGGTSAKNLNDFIDAMKRK